MVAKPGSIDLPLNSNPQTHVAERLAVEPADIVTQFLAEYCASKAKIESQVSDAPKQPFPDLVSDILETNSPSATVRIPVQSATQDDKPKWCIRRIDQYIDDETPQRIIPAGFSDRNGAINDIQNPSIKCASEVRSELVKPAVLKGFQTNRNRCARHSKNAPNGMQRKPNTTNNNRSIAIWSE